MKRPSLSWDDLQMFAAVARSGTISAAAVELGMSQPTAGRRMAALQRAIGAPLLQRSGRVLTLTDEGHEVLAHAEAMASHAVALERERAGTSTEVAGVLRVSTSEWFAAHVLSGAVSSLTQEQGGLTIELLTNSSLADLDRRDADIAFRFQPFTAPHVLQRRFVDIRYGLYVEAERLARDGPPRPGDGNVRLIGMDAAFDTVADMAWLRDRWPTSTFAVRSNSRDAQARACAAGAGIAVLPCIVGDANGLVRASSEEPPGRTVWVGYHQDLRRLARLRLLLDHLDRVVPRTL